MADLFSPESAGGYVEKPDNTESLEQYRQKIAKQHDELLRRYFAGEISRDELNKQVANLVTNQERDLREAQQEAAIDTLTGLYRPKLFQALVVYTLKQMARDVRDGKLDAVSGAFLFIDLDHFKTVNDTLGHYAGNLVLRAFGQTLLTEIRPGDTTCRYGGEEGIIFQPFQTSERAAIAANRYREAVPFNVSALHPELNLHQTVSIGIYDFKETDLSIFSSDEGVNQFISDSIKKADEAMYASKNAGRNRVTIYQPNLSISVHK